MSLSPDLYRNIRKALLANREFNKVESLRAIFRVDQRLSLWWSGPVSVDD